MQCNVIACLCFSLFLNAKLMFALSFTFSILTCLVVYFPYTHLFLYHNIELQHCHCHCIQCSASDVEHPCEKHPMLCIQ